MRTIELVKGIHSSVLGMSCSSMLGAMDKKKSERALSVAFECGINHLDIARSYGYGEAEAFVGKVIKGHRDKLVLASKFGIVANWKAKLINPLKPLVRLVRKNRSHEVSININPDNGAAPTIGNRFADRIPLNTAEMRRSLDRSLRALQTDYLDYFFIHEPETSVLNIDELFSTAELLKTEGKIRGWGLAYMRSQKHLHQQYLHRFDIQQFDNSTGVADYDRIQTERGSVPNIMFSVIKGGTSALTPKEKIQKLTSEFPKSVLLCSMFTENHIRENAQVAGA